MAKAQPKTSSTERAALSGDTQSAMGHIDYRGLTDGQIRDLWIMKFSSNTDRALHPENLQSIDRKWRRNRSFALAPGGKY